MASSIARLSFMPVATYSMLCLHTVLASWAVSGLGDWRREVRLVDDEVRSPGVPYFLDLVTNNSSATHHQLLRPSNLRLTTTAGAS